MSRSSRLEDQVSVKPARSRSRSRTPLRGARSHRSRSRSPKRLPQGPPKDEERWEMSAEEMAAEAERWGMGDGNAEAEDRVDVDNAAA